MKEKPTNKLQIFLIGGNSVIGGAILNGVLRKHKNEDIDIYSFIRTNYKEKIPGEVITVNDYIESVEYINNVHKEGARQIIIISFGVLVVEKKDNNFSENLNYHLHVNTFQSFNIFKLLLDSIKLREFHIVSSVLADFIRPSLYSYSVSKNLLELLIDNLIKTKEIKEKVFIWKPAFVDSRLNKGRKSSGFKTSPKKITNMVSKKIKGGSYYIPRVAGIFTFIAKFTSPLIKWVDKRI